MKVSATLRIQASCLRRSAITGFGLLAVICSQTCGMRVIL